MQEDNYSTQAQRGSPITKSESPIDRQLTPSPPVGEAGPSNSVPRHSQPDQQSYAQAHHPGTDFLLYDSWRNDQDSAEDFSFEEQTSNSQSCSQSQSQSNPYSTSNPGSQAPPAAPSPPPNDYGHAAEGYRYQDRRQFPTPLQTSPPMERFTQDHDRGAWSPGTMSAEQRREMLTGDHPDLKREREDDDKMERELTKLTEEERRRKRPRRRRDRTPSPRDMRDRSRDGDYDRGRRGGGQGNGQAVWSS